MSDNGPRYPKVRLKISGQDGNVFSIIGRARDALRKAKVPAEDIDAFSKECMSFHSYHDVIGFLCDHMKVS